MSKAPALTATQTIAAYWPICATEALASGRFLTDKGYALSLPTDAEPDLAIRYAGVSHNELRVDAGSAGLKGSQESDNIERRPRPRSAFHSHPYPADVRSGMDDVINRNAPSERGEGRCDLIGVGPLVSLPSSSLYDKIEFLDVLNEGQEFVTVQVARLATRLRIGKLLSQLRSCGLMLPVLLGLLVPTCAFGNSDKLVLPVAVSVGDKFRDNQKPQKYDSKYFGPTMISADCVERVPSRQIGHDYSPLL